jgi:hypothetical protein
VFYWPHWAIWTGTYCKGQPPPGTIKRRHPTKNPNNMINSAVILLDSPLLSCIPNSIPIVGYIKASTTKTYFFPSLLILPRPAVSSRPDQGPQPGPPQVHSKGHPHRLGIWGRPLPELRNPEHEEHAGPHKPSKASVIRLRHQSYQGEDATGPGSG